MLQYDSNTKQIIGTTGGYRPEGLMIRDIYVHLGFIMKGMHCMLYEPVVPTEKSRIGIIAIHSDDDYSLIHLGGELAKRGYRVLCGQVSDAHATLDAKMLDIREAVEFMRAYPGIEKVILMGHSGGATLMSAYQAAAENGPELFQRDNYLIKCSITEKLPAADGIMTLDSNWGNGAMTLFSIDPAVIEEGNGMKLDPELDVFNPANGYDPEGSTYSESFLKKFFAAQAERNNAIIRRALDRLEAIESGKGNYVDDEPFNVTAAVQIKPCNKLFPEDLRLLSHTKQEYKLLHKDGSATFEIIRSLRRPLGGRSMTPSSQACIMDTVRSYLTNRAVMAGEDYCVNEDGAEGILYENTYSCTPGNIRYIKAPLLVMGMTGGYEFLASETVYHNAASEDKSIAFMEGAGHNFDNEGRTEFGDTEKVVFDYLDEWLGKPGRFL